MKEYMMSVVSRKYGCRICLMLFVAAILTTVGFCEDWPTYMHDNARSGFTSEVVVLEELKPGWVHTSPAPPQRAWGNGMPWDAWSYNGSVPMRDFDSAFFVTVAGQDIFFGSSVTNSVHCLDAGSGRGKWFFRTDGAVRFPPSFNDGKLYFGSDDGHVYCVTASNGSLVWKYSPVAEKRVIMNNGNLITMSPVRTGTAVLDGKVYFAASLVPWKSSYLCSVDASTGSGTGTGLYTVSGGVAPAGAILASQTNIYLTQGRFYPQIFNRATGAPAGTLNGATGVFALLTSDGAGTGIVYGQGKDSAHGYKLATHSDKLAAFPGGKLMVVGNGMAYIITETFQVETTKGYRKNTNTTLKAVNRDDRSVQWTVPCNSRCFSMIMADSTLFVGGVDEVVAYDTSNGQQVWRQPVKGFARGLAYANQRLFVSTDSGKIYMFGKGNFAGADFDGDGDVDFADFQRFIDDYLRCTDPQDTECENVG